MLTSMWKSVADKNHFDNSKGVVKLFWQMFVRILLHHYEEMVCKITDFTMMRRNLAQKITFIRSDYEVNDQDLLVKIMFVTTLTQPWMGLQSGHFGGKTGNHLCGYQVVIEWLSSGDWRHQRNVTMNHNAGFPVTVNHTGFSRRYLVRHVRVI